jgi:4-diphosphocytidyl-2-C-methyl-D-erythritol kinase
MVHLRAPAKLNLYLRVLGRRPDGYHEIETLFERIDLADELTFEPQPRGLALTCTDLSAVPGTAQAGPALSCGEDNLVLKAARRLQEETGSARGARIHLTKRIPVAAGLGGGSSDAASALLGLNQLWQLELDRDRLIRIGAEIGSDVPFFLLDTPWAIGRGRGERCEPLTDLPPLLHVLVVPGVQLSTREVYEGFSPLTDPAPSITMVVHALRNGPALAGLAKGLWNDLEPEAIRRCPVITRILLIIRELGCLGTRLSGSGPAVFGLCRSADHASELAGRLRERMAPSWRVEIIQTDSPYSTMSVPSGGE